MMSKFVSCILLLLVVTSSGCKSYSTTALNRLGSGIFTGDSNGKPKPGCRTRPYKGIPVTLRVPTHLDIYIDETYFVKIDSGNKTASEPLAGRCRLLNIRTQVIESEKVFTVDFKRPASGVLDLDLTFNQDEQYFSKIVSQLQDDTIEDTAALVAQAINSIQAFQTSTGDDNDAEKQMMANASLIEDKRVVAYQRFDIDDPDFEYQVEQFVNQHLNHCNQCDSVPRYDLGITDSTGLVQVPELNNDAIPTHQ